MGDIIAEIGQAGIDAVIDVKQQIINQLPNNWDDMVSAYGRGYNWPTVGHSTTSRAYDAGWYEINVLKPAREADALRMKNTLVNFGTLKNTNVFGNTNRFTNSLGGTVYDGSDGSITNYKIDHYTGIAWYLVLQTPSDGLWATLIDEIAAGTFAGFNDWVLEFWEARETMYNIGASSSSFYPELLVPSTPTFLSDTVYNNGNNTYLVYPDGRHLSWDKNSTYNTGGSYPIRKHF